jgi:hypothetical protein
VDKNPVYSLHTSTLHELFPDAKYIILVRNYKDNVSSRKKYAYKPISVFELGVSWNFYYQAIFKTAAQYKLKIQILRYEDLVSAPKETLQKMCAYLDIDFKEDMLNYKEKAGEMKKHLKENTSGEKFDKVMQMHGNLENDVNTTRVNAHERELSEGENLILDYICYDAAKQFSYVNEKNKPTGKVSWRFRKAYYGIKMQMYLLKQKVYYNLPVSIRLNFLKKK